MNIKYFLLMTSMKKILIILGLLLITFIFLNDLLMDHQYTLFLVFHCTLFSFRLYILLYSYTSALIMNYRNHGILFHSYTRTLIVSYMIHGILCKFQVTYLHNANVSPTIEITLISNNT
jgi:hypothetical protein